jgi:hypothetical protein
LNGFEEFGGLDIGSGLVASVFYHISDGRSKFWPSSQNAKPASGRKEWSEAKKVVLSEAKDDLSKLLRLAEGRGLITRHGKPAGILIGFESEDDWFGLPTGERSRFLQGIESARISLRSG